MVPGEGRAALVGVAVALVFLASPQAIRGQAVELDKVEDLLSLPKLDVPPITFARPFIRFSPDMRRYIRIQALLQYKAKLHLGVLPQKEQEEPVTWDEPIPTHLCQTGFSGIVWRADSRRALFLQEPGKDEAGWVAGVYGRAMSPWAMCYDLANPQFQLCRHMRVDGATGCTSLSFSPDGKRLWTAFSDPAGFKACGITFWDEASDKGAAFYERKDAAIYHLAPSPDGKLLAWVEVFPRQAGARRGPEVVVMRVKPREELHRIALSSDAWNSNDVQPPIWTSDSKAVCMGDVVEKNRIFRREVRLLTVGAKESQSIAFDAMAVGTTPDGIVLNRGPACEPMRQLVSSYAPSRAEAADLPKGNQIILIPGPGYASSVLLVHNAFAQQIIADVMVYAQENADRVVVKKASPRRPAGNQR